MVWMGKRLVGRMCPVGRAKGGLLVGIGGGRLALVVWMIAFLGLWLEVELMKLGGCGTSEVFQDSRRRPSLEGGRGAELSADGCC